MRRKLVASLLAGWLAGWLTGWLTWTVVAVCGDAPTNQPQVVFLTAIMMHVLNQHSKAALLLKVILRAPPPPYELADLHFVLGRVLSHIETPECQARSQRHLQKSFALLKLSDQVCWWVGGECVFVIGHRRRRRRGWEAGWALVGCGLSVCWDAAT